MIILSFFTIIFKLFFFLNKKQIWFFIDRPFGVDNAYFIYKYVKKNDKNIKSIYLCENKKDAYFKDLLKDKNVVYKFSLRHLWYFVHAKNLIFSFDTDPFYFYKQGLIFKKLLKPKTKMIFLQHGVIHSLLPPYSKKYTHFDMFVCSARREMDQIKNDVMNYYSELKLTGLPRFDKLHNSLKDKIIFFMPTWNNKLLGKSIKEFKSSSYFKSINSFLSSNKLKQLLIKYDYKLCFIMHYMFNDYISLFNFNNSSIDIIKMNQSKEIIFPLKLKSSLLITNYSSVLFDFAYMKKPTLYYQFDKYHFKEDFNYKTEGFGKVVKTSDMLLIELEKILKNNCKMDKKYVKRVENFFEHIDANNCKRNYEEIKNL